MLHVIQASVGLLHQNQGRTIQLHFGIDTVITDVDGTSPECSWRQPARRSREPRGPTLRLTNSRLSSDPRSPKQRTAAALPRICGESESRHFPWQLLRLIFSFYKHFSSTFVTRHSNNKLACSQLNWLCSCHVSKLCVLGFIEIRKAL